jgi:proline iminopeptidase
MSNSSESPKGHDPLGGMTPGRHFVEVDGLCQAIEVAGNPKGPTCLVYPGGPGIDGDYLRMPILERRLNVIYIDAPGTGASDPIPSNDYGVENFARITREIISRLGLHRPVLLGHSHGGCVGLELAESFPDLLGALVAYSTGPVYGKEIEEEMAKQLDPFLERWPDRPEAIEAVCIVREGVEVVDDETLADELQAILPLYLADYRRTVAEVGPMRVKAHFDPERRLGRWDGRERLRRIRIPTLILHGRYDCACPPRWSSELHEGIKGSRVVELSDSGHFGHLESQRDQFAGEVAEFVEDVSATAIRTRADS